MERVRRIETWARLGYAARGVVYLLLGWIALSTNKALSTGEAVEAIKDLPAGTALLAAVAVGLFGYGAYKIYSAIVDLDGKGSETKGKIVRAARTLGGLGYLGLSYIAVSQLMRGDAGTAEAGRASGSGGSKQEAANQVAEATGGDLLLTLIGVGILAAAAAQFRIAWKASFMDDFAGAPPLVKPAGQLGYAARALVVAVVGYFVLKAGLDGERLRSFGDALALMRNFSAPLFKAIAVGLILFGLVSFAMARYRRIANEDVVARLKGTIAEHRHG